jgi:uncharacterized protein with PIN domain
MLGKCARYMRIMGYDTQYPNLSISDTELINICKEGDFTLVSRDRELCQRYKKSIHVLSDRIDEQILQIVIIAPPEKGKLFSRCTLCNGILEKGGDNCKDEYYNDGVKEVFHCPDCGKCYWRGTHWENILKKLKNLGIYDENQG